MNFPKLSYCIPLYNEENYLLSALKRVTTGLEKTVGHNKFEIILVDNGSRDKTPYIINKLKGKHIKAFSIKKRGIGAAYRLAIKNAKYDHRVLSAIDLPFGFTDLNNAHKFWNKHDIIFGSKAHPDSKIYVSLNRRISSIIYRFLLNIFFNLKIKDPQGSVFLKKSKIVKVLEKCNSDNAFFTSQLAIYGKLAGLTMSEVPVSMSKQSRRKSKFNLLKDGSAMFFSILREYAKIKKLKS